MGLLQALLSSVALFQSALLSAASPVSYQGKSVDAWFEQAATARPSFVRPVPDGLAIVLKPEAMELADALRGMGERALPGLLAHTRRSVAPFGMAYARVWTRMPAAARRWLPQPPLAAFADRPAQLAWELVGVVLSDLKRTRNRDAFVSAPNVRAVIPALETALNDLDGKLQLTAVRVAGVCGPLAKPLLPRLTALCEEANGNIAEPAAFAIAQLGCLASNAVPALMRRAATEAANGAGMEFPVRALGNIGPAAAPAAPLLASLMSNGSRIRPEAIARALAQIGQTPDAALPSLQHLAGSGTDRGRAAALLALWQREPDAADLQAPIRERLRSPEMGERLAILDILRDAGPRAEIFLPEVRALECDADPMVRGVAQAARRKLAPSPAPEAKLSTSLP